MKRYEETATRLEHRGDNPPTREYVDNLVKTLTETGIEASWHSGVDRFGRPLYPSKIVPNCHPQADLESYKYLIDSLHAVGRPVLSWYPMGMNIALAEAHPDWRMVFYEIEGIQLPKDWTWIYCCYNSPYGQILPELVVEMVRDVGFDGVWFDGSTWSCHGTWPMYLPGCKCDHCREKFRKDTGLDLPEKVDFEDRTFRIWVNWRYDVLMDVYKRICDAVVEVRPDAAIGFNNYRRRIIGKFMWNTAIPLRSININGFMSTEADCFANQVDFQMKINRAFGAKRGVESWMELCDYWTMWAPDAEPLSAVQAALGCISAGGGISSGIGVDPSMIPNILKPMQEAAAPLMPYIGGETVEYAAILCSQQTQDFCGKDDGAAFFDEWHGANELCRHSHVQSSVVFDDHVERGELEKYPIVILGNAACVSKKQAEQLEKYVREGGSVIACHLVGTLDELGYPHEKPVLDDLLGIKSRRVGQGLPTYEICDSDLESQCGKWVTVRGAYTVPEAVDDVVLLADVIDRPWSVQSEFWKDDFVDFSTGKSEGGFLPKPSYPGLWMRKVGKGWVVYSSVDLFKSYLHTPTPHFMRMIKGVMKRLANPAIELEGPMCVTVNSRKQEDGRISVHLHNAPGTAYRYPNPPSSNYLHTPGEVVPVHDLKLIFRDGGITSAVSGVSGKSFEVVDDGRGVVVPRVELHDVVLVRKN